jgi:hypothetical protein
MHRVPRRKWLVCLWIALHAATYVLQWEWSTGRPRHTHVIACGYGTVSYHELGYTPSNPDAGTRFITYWFDRSRRRPIWTFLGFGYDRVTLMPGLGELSSILQIDVPLWPVTVALVVREILKWSRTDSAGQRNARCPICGYDLRASSERCPECGAPKPTAV